jgi:hypothetical protein
MAVIDEAMNNEMVEATEYDPYGRHRVIDPGTDATYFTSDDTYDEMAPGGLIDPHNPGLLYNAIRYTGQRFDAESGLMYFKRNLSMI